MPHAALRDACPPRSSSALAVGAAVMAKQGLCLGLPDASGFVWKAERVTRTLQTFHSFYGGSLPRWRSCFNSPLGFCCVSPSELAVACPSNPFCRTLPLSQFLPISSPCHLANHAQGPHSLPLSHRSMGQYQQSFCSTTQTHRCFLSNVCFSFSCIPNPDGIKQHH